jgi:cell division protein FtsA
MLAHNKSKGSLIAALDIGSSKVTCFIGRVVDEACKIDVVGVGHTPAKGIQNGSITNLKDAEHAIRQSVHAAEYMAATTMKGYPLREVIVNVPGQHTRSFAQHVEIKIGGYDITDKDITRALSRAQNATDLQDRKLIHTIPVAYTLDENNTVREPRGMNAGQMGVDIHMIAAEQTVIKNTTKCIERSHLDIYAYCASAYAAGLSSLVQDEMDLGCTIIDIGGGVTSFAVFHDGQVVYTDAIPVGGHHVTNDIAQGLTTSVKDAERLKCLYGSAMAGHTDETELIDVPKLGEIDRTRPNHVARSILIGIIQPRMEEIFEMVRGKLKDSGLSPVLGRRVILTGGASQLHGVCELAEHVLDKHVRLGHPIKLGGLPDAVSGPAFSTVAGLLTYACAHAHEIPSEITAEAESGSLLLRAKQWLKENW